MPAPILYDVTRLASRAGNATPNGIDRVDFAYARHVFARESGGQGFIQLPWGQRVVEAAAGAKIVDAIEDAWSERGPADDESVLAEIRGWLAGQGHPAAARRLRAGGGWRLGPLQKLVRAVARPAGAPRTAAAKDAVYLNVSQFPLWLPVYFRWLRDRPDVALVAMIHDLLPLEYPEYFSPGEYSRHHRRLAFLAERGAAAIVSTQQTKSALLAYLSRLGRERMPVHVAPLPVPGAFAGPAAPDPSLAAHPYFVVCGTIEPRKNHLFLLHLWRAMVAARGGGAPKLIIVGRRGWENEGALDMLERCRVIRGCVIEVTGLSSPVLRRLMDNARGMLAPSFCEGYGLPVAEARAAGVPLLASDLSVFREIAGAGAAYLDPLDGPGWIEAITRLAQTNPGAAPCEASPGPAWEDYFAGVEEFLGEARR